MPPSKRIDRDWLFWTYLACIALSPWFMWDHRPLLWASPVASWYALALTMMIPGLRKNQQIPPSFYSAKPSVFILVVVLFWMFAQWFEIEPFGTLDRHATYVEIIRTGSYVSAYLATLWLVDSRSRVRTLLWVIALTGTAQTIVALTNQTYGSFFNHNHFAGFLVLAIAAATGLMVSSFEDRKSRGLRDFARQWIKVILGPKVFIRALIVVLVVGLIYSRSVTGNAAFVLALTVAGLVGLLTFKSVSRSMLMFFVSVALIDVLLLGSIVGIDRIQERVEGIAVESDYRVNFNEESLDLAKENWAFGAGAGTYYTAYPQVRSQGVTGRLMHAHNDYLEFLVELGVAALLLGSLVVHSAYTSIKVQFDRRSQILKSSGFASLMAIASIAVFSATDFNLELTATATLFMVLLALPHVAISLRPTRDRIQASS